MSSVRYPVVLNVIIPMAWPLMCLTCSCELKTNREIKKKNRRSYGINRVLGSSHFGVMCFTVLFCPSLEVKDK